MDHLPPKPLKIALGLFRNLQTFAEIFAQARCIIGINDTGGKFATGTAGVVDTGGKFTPISTTPAVNLLRISS
jgi:hypothetical protein